MKGKTLTMLADRSLTVTALIGPRIVEASLTATDVIVNRELL